MNIMEDYTVKIIIGGALLLVVAGTTSACSLTNKDETKAFSLPKEEEKVFQETEKIRTLPKPETKSLISVEQALQKQQEKKEINPTQPLSLENLSQILWSAKISQNLNEAVQIYVVVEGTNAVNKGVYRYSSEEHGIIMRNTITREEVAQASQKNTAPSMAAVTIVVTGNLKKAQEHFPQKSVAEKELYTTVGSISTQIALQSETQDNTTSEIITEIDSTQLQKLLQLPKEEVPVAMIAVGKKK